MSSRETTQEATMGSRKYRERIHRDSQRSNNLPYTFSAPKKGKASNIYFKCSECGHESTITEDTIMVICSQCSTVNRLRSKKEETEKAE